MCLGIPGKVIEVRPLGDLGLVEGRVDFGGVVKDVNLSFTPDVEEGQYVIVHVGFSISILDEEEAHRTLEVLAQLGEATAPPDLTAGAKPSSSGSAAAPPEKGPRD